MIRTRMNYTETLNRLRRYFLIFLALLPAVAGVCQTDTIDSINWDRQRIGEELLLSRQQQKLDSLMKVKLEMEIAQLSDNSKQRNDLEERLKEVAANDSLRNLKQRERVLQLRKTAVGYPVRLFDDTLFLVYIRLGSFSPKERADVITDRIHKMYENDFYNEDSLQVVPGENSHDIVYNGEQSIMSVTEIDALFHEKDTRELATEYLNIIRTAINKDKEANSLISWVKRIGLVVLIVLGIALLIYAINRLFYFFRRKIVKNKDRYFQGIRIRTFKLFDQQEHLRFILRIFNVLRLLVIVLALYMSLPLLFSIFPQTEVYTYTLLHWVISPAKSLLKSIFTYLPNLFTIIVIYLFAHYAIKGIKFIADEIRIGDLKIRGFYPDWAHPTFNIARFLIYALMLIIIFPYLPGSDSPAFQGVSVFLGILFSLGSSTAISNIVAGLVITDMRPFKVGDRVKIGEVTGDVLEKSLLVTRLRTIKNEEITVPNASVLSSYTTNFTMGAESMGLIIHSTVTIGYDVPWKKMHQTLIDAALKTKLIEKEPAPFVLQTSLEDFYVSYQINAYTRQPSSMAEIHSDLHQQIQDACAEAGIEIMSPHYRSMRDGNESTIPGSKKGKA